MQIKQACQLCVSLPFDVWPLHALANGLVGPGMLKGVVRGNGMRMHRQYRTILN